MIKVVAETCSHSKSRRYIVAYSPRYLIKEYKFEKAVWHVTRIGNHLLCKHALLSKSDHTVTDFLSWIPSHETLEFKGNTDKPSLDLVLYWLKYKTFCSSSLMKWKYLRFSNFFNRKTRYKIIFITEFQYFINTTYKHYFVNNEISST